MFTVEVANCFNDLYSSSTTTELQNQGLKEVSKKLLSVLTTLGENPYIRYFDPTNQQTNKSSTLALQLQKDLEEYCAQDPDYPPKQYQFRPKATVLILERSFDMVAPLLHEFTYQAMINDLLVTASGKLK